MDYISRPRAQFVSHGSAGPGAPTRSRFGDEDIVGHAFLRVKLALGHPQPPPLWIPAFAGMTGDQRSPFGGMPPAWRGTGMGVRIHRRGRGDRGEESEKICRRHWAFLVTSTGSI